MNELLAGAILGMLTSVPMRDACVYDAAQEFAFVRWTSPPAHRPLTLEENAARTMIEICRWQAGRAKVAEILN